MDKKTQQIIIIAGIAVAGYYFWKRSQNSINGVTNGEEGTSSFGGRRKRKKADNAMQELCTYCTNHNCSGNGCCNICGCPDCHE